MMPDRLSLARRGTADRRRDAVLRGDQDQNRIASPEMLPRGQLLPHLKCSPGSSRGSEHEDSEHGDAAGAGGGDKGEVRFCSAEREDQDPR
jgi:hypothetical protein